MKHSAEYNNFTGLVDRILSVSHDEIKRRESDYKKRSKANPRKRGPKPKQKMVKPPSASPGPAS